MAFALVQSPTQVTGTAASVSVTVAATGAGNLVVIYASPASTSTTLTSVTDNVGNAYVVSSALDNTPNLRIYMAYGVQVTGGATAITTNWSNGTETKRVGLDEFSGGASNNTNAFDTSSTGTGTTSTATSVASFTPAGNGELIVAMIKASPQRSITAGTNFTISSGTSTTTVRSEYRLSSSGSETAPGTLASAPTVWGEIAMAFKPASGGSTPNSGFFRFM